VARKRQHQQQHAANTHRAAEEIARPSMTVVFHNTDNALRPGLDPKSQALLQEEKSNGRLIRDSLAS
jgi:hypothetical protein